MPRTHGPSRTGAGSVTGPALDAAILFSYKRGEPVLTYCGSRTPSMGRVDRVRPEEKPGPEPVAVLEKVNLPIDLRSWNLGRGPRCDGPAARFASRGPVEGWHT